MNLPIVMGLAAALMACGARAQPPLDPRLAGLGFLVGDWTSGEGTVADTGGTAHGASRITEEANGAVLLRRDHTELTDAHGKPAGAFDQIMMIYPDAGGVRADYSDGSHVIHYAATTIDPGRSVTFASLPAPGAPTFRLTYALASVGELTVAFGMIPPGGDFRAIATGVLHKTP